MHIDIVPNRTSPPAVLLRESYREDGKVKKRTLANLSSLPADQVDAIRRVLKGERLASAESLFQVTRSRHHGHVEAVLKAMKRLGFETLLASRPSRERDLAVALVAARLLEADSKLATTRWWQTTTLPELCGVGFADEDDLYEAMDWLLERQPAIEKKLAARHLKEGGLVLMDISSSYFEGQTCPLASLGFSRDGKPGTLQVNYGLTANDQGCPVGIRLFEGNTGDPTTLLPQVERVRDEFGLSEMVVVGDRGLIAQKQVDALQQLSGVAWITALRTQAIRKLVSGGALQLDLFDQRDLFEIRSPDFPGERLIACRNPYLAQLRAQKRQDLIEATQRELDKVHNMVLAGTLKGQAEIGLRTGRVVNKYKVAKHFRLAISDNSFAYPVNDAAVAAEAALDGIYVIRTSVPPERMDSDQVVRSYKSLSTVERAFRSFKSIDLRIRPIYHHLEHRVRAHAFLCMLAYYVQWHMTEAWRPLLFCDEDQAAKQTRHPVHPAQRSQPAQLKAQRKRDHDGSPTHSFRSLLQLLSSVVCNTCSTKGDEHATPFLLTTTPCNLQQRALDLLQKISV